MLSEQREIMDESATFFTNSAPVMISKAESLAERQKNNADLWIPLKQALLQAVTNQQQQAALNQQIELGRDTMTGVASAFEDLLPEASAESTQLEPLIYNFWKMTAAPGAIIDEDIICQSNAIRKIDRRYLENRDSQLEARELTSMFSERFPQWADQYIQQAQADTNMPPFTAEDKAEIEELAAHVLNLQSEIIDKKLDDDAALPLRTQALKELLEIREKLPKNPNSQQNQQQQQQQQDQQQQQQQDQQQQQEQEQQEEPQKQPQQEQKEEPPEDVQELLRRALEREKEHEDEKKQRMRSVPLAPNMKDW